MNKEYNCPYSFIDGDLICEHKFARTKIFNTPTLHNHNGYEIVLFLAGDVTIYVESDAKKLERGDLVLVNPYSFHGIMLTDLDSYERITVNIRENYMPTLSDKDTDLSTCFRRKPSTSINYIRLDEQAIQMYFDIADKLENTIKGKGYAYKLLQKAYITELLSMINLHMDTYESPSFNSIFPPLITNIHEIINENLTRDLTVEEIGKRLHHNSDYLNRAFKTYTGNSLKHFITAKKISLAQQYLTQGYSPYDVCFMVGYNNYSTFSRCFTNQIGLSPKKYQLANR